MLNKSDLILFLTEIWKRLGEKSPKFFRVVGWISVVMSIIGFVPDFLTFLDVQLPATWMKVVGKLLIGAGIWGKLTASLAIKAPASTIMPFTVKKQIQQDIKAEQLS